MEKHEELTIMLKKEFQVVERGDGTFIVTDAESSRYLVLDQIEAALVKEFDGRTLSDIAYQAYLKYNCIPFQKLKSLTGQLKAAGMLEEKGPKPAAAGMTAWNYWEIITKLLNIKVFQQKSRTEGNQACTNPHKGSAPWLSIIMLIAGAGLLACLGLPQLTDIFTTEGSCMLSVLVIYFSAVLAGVLRSLARRLCLARCGLSASPFSLYLTYGVLRFDLGSAALIRAPRDVRLNAALLSLAALTLTASIIRLLASITLTDNPAASMILSLECAGLLLAIFLDLCPVGPSAVNETYSSYSNGNDAVQNGFTYLKNRMLRRLFTSELFEGEKTLIVFCCWTLIWCILAFSMGADFMEKNKEALASLYLNGSGTFTTAVIVMLMALLCFISLSVLFGLLNAILVLIRSAAPRRSIENRIPSLKSLEKERIIGFLRSVPFFSQSPDELLANIAESSRNLAFAPGDVIIRQGEKGDSFFVITEGSALVVREDEAGNEIRIATLTTGDCFGEVALVESVPRTATVKASSKGSTLALNRRDFMKAAEAVKGADVISLVQGYHMLYQSPFFSSLETEAMTQLLHMAERVSVEPGQVVISHGDVGDRFYVVLKGELDVMDSDEKQVIRTLRQGDPFGEIALLADTTRTATVIARTHGDLIALDRGSFNEFFSRYFALGEKLEKLGAQRLSDYSGGAS
jgi:CRP-like cAMP-binding protein